MGSHVGSVQENFRYCDGFEMQQVPSKESNAAKRCVTKDYYRLPKHPELLCLAMCPCQTQTVDAVPYYETPGSGWHLTTNDTDKNDNGHRDVVGEGNYNRFAAIYSRVAPSIMFRKSLSQNNKETQHIQYITMGMKL